MGPYYFGDRILEITNRKGRDRALVLELVIEAIESNHLDGSTFTTWGLGAGFWGSRVYQALRWLEHQGLIARVPKCRNQLNEWFVVKERGQL